MIYRLINMSDDYTLKSDSFRVACMAAWLLGAGWYPLESEERSMPVFLGSIGCAESWVVDEFDCTMEELVESISETDLADCLDSVLIGDRDVYESAIKFMPVDTHAAFRKEWHEKNLSSLNDIGRKASELASGIRERITSG